MTKKTYIKYVKWVLVIGMAVEILALMTAHTYDYKPEDNPAAVAAASGDKPFYSPTPNPLATPVLPPDTNPLAKDQSAVQKPLDQQMVDDDAKPTRIGGRIYQHGNNLLAHLEPWHGIEGKYDIYGDVEGCQGLQGLVVRNGGQYDIYSAAQDCIGHLKPFGNEWHIYSRIEGYVGFIDRGGDWHLRPCHLIGDLGIVHEFFVREPKVSE